MSRPRLIALLLAFLTLVVYLPVVHHGFLNYDDDDYVTNNPMVENGLTFAGVKWAFTTGHASNWHPLTWLSLMLDVTLFGLNAGAMHFVNVLFHAANVALLFVLLLRLTGRVGPSVFIAALFGWHPLHVESVAWIAERKDVLSTFFALLSLLAYAKSVQEKSRRQLGFALLFFALGLMAKPMLVTLPFVMLLVDFWPFRRFNTSTFQRLIVEKVPFFVLTVVSCVVTYLAQSRGHAVAALGTVPLVFRLENAVVAVAHYAVKLFWPEPMAVIYPLVRISFVELAPAAALLILVSLAAWHWRKSRPYFLIGWLWFVGTLVPVIGLVQVGAAAMADRYTYIPSIGFFMAVVFGLDELAGRFPAFRRIVPTGAILLLAVSVFGTEIQLRYWRNSETLFRHSLAVTRNNDIARFDLGLALDQEGKTAEALAQYREALQLNPDRYQIHNNIGIILDQQGRAAAALKEFRDCIKLAPNLATFHNSAGNELVKLGKYDEALKEFAEAGRLDPHSATPHIEIAKVFFREGRDAKAVDELHTALQLEPDNFQILVSAAHYLAANEDASARNARMALTLALKANQLSGHSQPMVYDILGMAFADVGDFSNAVTCAQNALDLANAAKMKHLEPIQQRLDLYQKRRPWRESFRATNSTAKAESP